MTELPKTHRLSFRRDSLEPILAGHKTATIRLADRAYLIRPGHRLELLCGHGDDAVVVDAVAKRAQRVFLDLALDEFQEVPYIEALMAHGELVLDELNDPDDEPLIPEVVRGGVSRVLTDACEKTSGTETVARMLKYQLGTLHLIWWRLGTPGLVG